MASIDPKAIPSPSPGSIIDLSKQYIYRHQITSFHGRRNIHSFLMEGSVMIDTTPESMQELQNLLTELSPQRIVFAKSNVSGRVFYKGKEFMVENPVEEHVTVESTGPDGRPVVRDDSPPRTFHDGSTIYHFVKTVYDPATNKFFRYYVILDWLKSLVEMDMSGTSISGYGLTSLVAASASRLESLKLTGCAGVDNRGLYAIATLCTNLKVLDISHCAKITSHGIMYLSEFAPAQVQQLTSINIINSHLPSDITYALFCALEDRGFNGSVFGLVQDPRDRDVTHVREFRGPPLAPGQTRPRKLVQAYERSPDCIVDLAMHDITQRVLTSLPPDPTTHTTYYCLDLSDCLINDRLLDMILNYWGSRLHTLRVDGTYITQKGLEYFERCPELRILSMARCWNIIYKSEANRSIMAAINRMLSLRQVNVADSRLSGRMLSEHPRLRLTAYNATRCPISVHAVRMLATECHDTMTHLILSGCSFLNTKAIHYFLKFTRLVHLDLSYCTGLTASDIQLFRRWPPSTLSHLRELVVSGIRDCDGIMCQGLANALTQLSESGEAIRIIGDQHDSKPAVFTGESVMESCPYATILPTIHSAAVATAAAHLNIPGVSRTTTVEEKNVTAPSYMMLAGNEMLHPASSRATALLTQQMSTLTIPDVVKPTPTHTDPSSTYLMMNSTDVIPSEHKQSLYGTESIPTYSHHTQTTRPILSHAPSFFDDAMCTRQSPTLQTSPSTSTQSYHRLDANAMVPDTQHIMAQIRQQQQQHGATSPPQQRASITSNTLPIHSHPSLASQASFIPEAYIRMTGADMHPSSQQLAASAAAYVPPPPVSVSSTSMPSPPPMPLPSIPVSIPLTAADSSDAPA